MLRFPFLLVFFSLLLLACGKHDLTDYGYVDDDEDQLLSSSSGISSSGTSSSSEPPMSSSSLHELSSSSSSSYVETYDCDFRETSYINSECFYGETISVPQNVLLGSQARLHFAENTSLNIRGYHLEINKGAKLYFGKNSELLIDNSGSLDVSGEEEIPVLFAADENEPWKGIRIHPNALSVNIKYADLSGALTGITFGKNSVLKNSKIYNNEYGIKQNSPFSTGNFSGNNFYSNDYDAGVSLAVAATLGSPEQFTGKLHISGNQDIGNVILPGFNYFVNGTIIVNDELEIDAGAHFYFTENSSVAVTIGSIKAIGVAGNPIIFEPADSESFWGNSDYSLDKEVAFYFDGGCAEKSEFEYFEVLRTKIAFNNQCLYPVELSNGRVIDYSQPPFKTTDASIILWIDRDVEVTSNYVP